MSEEEELEDDSYEDDPQSTSARKERRARNAGVHAMGRGAEQAPFKAADNNNCVMRRSA